jgi:phosphomannomutase/phosphoglucomutase
VKAPRSIFRAYDVRGHAERDLGGELAFALASAITVVLARTADVGRKMRVALARDCRVSSDRLARGLTDGFLRSGVDVVDLGVGPTPLLYYGAQALGTEGAVMVTASHNPPEDNGFKILAKTTALYGEAIAELHGLLEGSLALENGAGAERGVRSEMDLEGPYLAALTDHLEVARPLSVVVDAGSGAAGPLAVAALRRVGAEVDPLYCEMDGRFPHHHPDPVVPQNLADLVERVRATGADLGVALDGDGDRIAAVGQTGQIAFGDRLLALFARSVLAHHPGAAIVGEVKCSNAVFTDVRAHGGRAFTSKSGHSFVKAAMKKHDALLGGELSGHLFFRDRYFGYDDGIYAALRLVELLASGAASLEERLSALPVAFASPELRIPCSEEEKVAVVDHVARRYRALGLAVDDLDGARITFESDAWGLVRASNTGPLVTVRAEGPTERERDRLLDELARAVEEAMRAMDAMG